MPLFLEEAAESGGTDGMAITSVGNTSTISTSSPGATNRSAMALVTTLFFVWGFCTVLNDILIPHLQTVFNLSYGEASYIQIAFFGSYFIFAQPSSKIVEWIGYQRTMVVGLIAMGIGALLVIPAAKSASYPFFLVAEVVLAAGITALQVAANPYVTVLGPPETASTRLNLTQAFNAIGDVVAPYVGAILILGGATAASSSLPTGGAALTTYRSHLVSSVQLPYLGIAAVMIVLALAIAFYRFPRLEITRDFRPANLNIKQDSVWNHPHLYLGAIGIFVYCGAEVSVGSFMAKYLADPRIGNFPLETAAKLVTFFWAGMVVGRFLGSALMKRIAPQKLLVWFGVGAGSTVLCSLFSTGHLAVVSILCVGLFNSIMFPTIFTLGVAELGPLTGRGSGLLVQAIVGAGVFSFIMGHLADHIGIHHSLIIPFLCYLFIIFYGMRGYRIAPSEAHATVQAVRD